MIEIKKFVLVIDEVRKKLNDLIENNADYSAIYKVSIELDKLIAEFYERQKKAS